jgi:arginine:pyruvate transaminase
MKLAAITRRLSGLGSDKWAVHIEGKRRAGAGEDLIFLSIGEPDVPPPAAIMDVVDAQMRAGRYKYAASRGENALLESLSKHYSKSAGRAISPRQFIFLPGTQTGLFVAMQATLELGDEVLLPDPYYATYEGVIAAAGGVAVPVAVDPDHGFHLKAGDLERAITPRTRLLLLNTPSNPTGAVLTRDEIKAIGEVCERHGLWIVSDEVYASMTYGNAVFASPFDDPALEKRVIVVSSISKSHAMPGFRCGWLVASEDFCEQVLPLTETMLFGSQAFLEDATAFALANHFPEVDAARASYERRARALVAGLEGAAKISARMPEGGMFVMVDVRKTGLSGEAFARKLLAEENVVTMPGESFGQGGAGHIRVSLTVDEAQIAEACRRMVKAANSRQAI